MGKRVHLADLKAGKRPKKATKVKKVMARMQRAMALNVPMPECLQHHLHLCFSARSPPFPASRFCSVME